MYEKTEDEEEFQPHLDINDIDLTKLIKKSGQVYLTDEGREMVRKWRIEQERLVERLPKGEYRRGQVLLEMKQAMLLEMANCLDEALEILYLEAVRTDQEGFDDLAEEIDTKIGELEKLKEDSCDGFYLS